MRIAVAVLGLVVASGMTQCGAIGFGAIGDGSIGGLTSSATATPPGSPDVWFAGHLETGNFSNNDAVDTLTDNGFIGADATQATPGDRPTFKNPCEAGKLNEQPCFDFDGAGDFLAQAAQTAAAQPAMVAAVISPDTAGTKVALDGVSARNFLNTTAGRAYNANWGVSFTSTETYSDGEYDWICVYADTTSSSFVVSGVSTAGSIGNNSWTGAVLGASNADSFHFDGRIAEYLYYDNPVSQGIDCTDIGTYFDEVYGSSWPQ